ncbi:MAG TPA: GAF domain-containing sensor histidine kinase [Candidatus Limnocylindrales bacterium]
MSVDVAASPGDPSPQPLPELPAPAGTRSLPLVVALDALETWSRDPNRPQHGLLREALTAIVEVGGARGAWLDVDAPPLPAFQIGVGSLDRPPSARRRKALVKFPLSAEEGRVRLGSIFLDAAAAHAEHAVRALEIALDAAWSRAEVRHTGERLEALDMATRAIAGVLSVDRVLQLIIDRVRDLVGARYAALGIVDQEGVIERFITSGISRIDRERIGAVPRGHGILGLIIRENRSIRIPDIATDARRYGFPPNHPDMHSFLGVPVSVKGRSIGNFYLTDKENGVLFSERDQAIVEMFARHAAIAIENARLHEQVQRLAVVEERERIGQDLHDGIIQSIYAVGLSLEDVPDLIDEGDTGEAKARVDRAIEGLNLSIRDIRNFIFGLRPELLEKAGLMAGLAALADEFRLNTMVDVDLAIDGRDIGELSEEHTLQFLHIAREALSNVARHSKATRARIELAVTSDELRLVIADNGIGFAVNDNRGPGHQGLNNMRARATALGGRLDLESERDQGTRIIVAVPHPRPEGGNR